jgi:hypothetical protein
MRFQSTDRSLPDPNDSNAPSTGLTKFSGINGSGNADASLVWSEIIGGKARFQPCQTVQGDQASARHSLRLTIFGLNLHKYCASHARLTRNSKNGNLRPSGNHSARRFNRSPRLGSEIPALNGSYRLLEARGQKLVSSDAVLRRSTPAMQRAPNGTETRGAEFWPLIVRDIFTKKQPVSKNGYFRNRRLMSKRCSRIINGES